MEYSNLTLMTDFYQLTMMQGYFLKDMKDKKVVFDLFYRKNPCDNGFSIAAGLEQVIEYIKNIKFSDEDIEYISTQKVFRKEFIDYLKNFKFTGDIYAILEGSIIFPNEPILQVHGNIIEAQFIETALLNMINHQSLIATKASRVLYAADGDRVNEFGLRRSQGPDAGIYGSRAAIIAGCHGTSNVLAGKLFNVPIFGTHAHSWIMSFPDELSGFRAYADIYPQNCTLLVDTYDTLKSGIPNSIIVFKELIKKGQDPKSFAIRLDSGDLSYLSKEARKMLDDEGLQDVVIGASSDLDEYLISDLKLQGAKITSWGVGTNLITSKDCPAFGGVYKLSAESDENFVMQPKIKLSENPEKLTNPGSKKVYRLYSKATNKIKGDLITLIDETINENEDLTIFDPNAIWKRMTLKAGSFYTKELLVTIFKNGNCVYVSPSVMEIRDFCKTEISTLWNEHRRLMNPQSIPVDLSQKLWDLKQNMINSITYK